MSARAIGTSLVIKGTTSTDDVEIGSLTSIGEITIESDEIDVTTLDSTNGAEFEAGNVTASDCSISGYIKKQADEEQVADLLDLVSDGTTKEWEIVYPSGAKMNFNAFVKSFGLTEATPDGLVGFTGSLKLSGLPTYTPSSTPSV